MPRPETGTDTYVYNALDKIVPTFCKYNIHPNVITLVSLLSNKILFEALKNIPKNKTLIFLLMLSHGILDCLDGEIARGCKQYSKLGSRLDYLNDQLFMSIILVLLISKNYKMKYSIRNIIIMTGLLSTFNTMFSNFNIDDHSMDSPVANFIHDNSVLMICIVFYILVK